MNMLERIQEIHRQAMDLAEDAYWRARRGDDEGAAPRYKEAFECERKAAQELAHHPEIEPTRSVLFRSAATLGLRCGEHREAERLAAAGLAGNPPHEIAEELRNVFDEANFRRHLANSELVLSQSFQFSLWGDAVSSEGDVAGNEFAGRFRDTERLLQRTAARGAGYAFTETLPKVPRVSQCNVFLSPARANSFSVTLTLGVPDQPVIPGLGAFSSGAAIVDEFMQCMTLLNDQKDKELAARIADPSYFANFMALAQKIAPDGKKIKGVGFTSNREGSGQAVGLTRTKDEIHAIVLPQIERRQPEKPKKRVEIVGVLRFADGISDENTVKVVDARGTNWKVTVPPGLMSDIVRPLWGQRVIIAGRARRHNVSLEDISVEGDD